MTTKFHEANRASEILAKIGKGAVDTDFARTVHEAIDAAQTTGKKAKVVVTVEIEPDEDKGCLMLRAGVSAKIPKLPLPGSQMHVGDRGQLLTQQEWMFGGGRDEAPAKPLPIEQVASPSASGRLAVVNPPAPRPVVALPPPAPVVGKDAASSEKAQ